MKYLFVLNEPPYGNERSYNGLRLALSLAKQSSTEIRVFLMGDAVALAKSGQQVVRRAERAWTLAAWRAKSWR